MRFSRTLGPIVLTSLLVGPGLRAQPVEEGGLAFPFAYRPETGRAALCDAGYRRHLDWHRERDDPLPWYARYVVIGERRGLFVDGTFGISGREFQQRVDPTGDRADFDAVRAVDAEVWAYRPDLSLFRADPTEEDR